VPRWRFLATFLRPAFSASRVQHISDLHSKFTLEIWANAQRDGRPAEYRCRPLFNATKFGWRQLLECRAVTLPRRETRSNYLWCPKLTKRSQPLVGRSSPYCEDMWRIEILLAWPQCKFRMQVWNVLRTARWKYRTQKIAKKSSSGHYRTTLSGYIFATKACIDNRKKTFKQQYLLHMPPQYSELRPTSGWDHFVTLGHPCKFERVSRLGSVTARHSSSGLQPNFAALNIGRHLYSAGRPSRWALAHISSSFFPRHMSLQYGELWPTSGWDCFVSLGHPTKFQLLSHLGSVTARHVVVGVSQTLRRWIRGATYVREGDHHVGHWLTFLVMVALCNRADHYIFALWFLSSSFFFLLFSFLA